jgi:hypothetical protein
LSESVFLSESDIVVSVGIGGSVIRIAVPELKLTGRVKRCENRKFNPRVDVEHQSVGGRKTYAQESAHAECGQS